MSTDTYTAILGKWEGYWVRFADRVTPEGSEQEEVWIELAAEARTMRCSCCGDAVESVHDCEERWVRDLPILGAVTWLLLSRYRVKCPRCGPKLEALSWLEPYSRLTRRMAENVARLCKVMTIKHVAAYTGLGWDAVKQIDQAYMKRELGPVDLSGIEYFIMDEFAIHKGQRYATVFLDPIHRRVLYVCRGNSRKSIRPFFRLLGLEGRKRIQAVGMDMCAAFELEVRARCKNAEIVYDLFHVVKKYGKEVIDRVRVDEANRLREDPKKREVIKGARWLLLRNRRNITSWKNRVRLRELLKANRRLMTVYVLMADLKHLWDYRYPGAAKRFFKRWMSRAMRSRIEPLKTFARKLKGYLPGILSHCRWPLHTSMIEGVNNKIKVIKRMAYGYRDEEYFFLKIRAAFPGKPG